jgi:hypothetical protein
LFPFVKSDNRDETTFKPLIESINDTLAKLDGELQTMPPTIELGSTLALCDCGYAVVLFLLFAIVSRIDVKLIVPTKVATYFDRLKLLSSVDNELKSYGAVVDAWLK